MVKSVTGIFVCLVVAAIPGVAMAGTATLAADLNGANETGGGDADGTGNFTGEIDVETGDLCYILVADKIAKAVAAHIHQGAAGSDGAPVVTLEVTGPEDLCIAVEPDTLKAIAAAPADYYINVHTADYPAGAVRGQISMTD